MADYLYPIKVAVSLQGATDPRPLYNGSGTTLILIATGGTSYFTPSTCYAIPQNATTTDLAITASTTNPDSVYAKVAAVRPGAGISFGSGTKISTGRTWNDITAYCTLTTGNKYITTSIANRNNIVTGNLNLSNITSFFSSITGGTVEKTAKMSDASGPGYWDIRTGSTSNILPTSQMGDRCAPISKIYFRLGTAWKVGGINYYTMPVGYVVSGTSSNIYGYVKNSSSSPIHIVQLSLEAYSNVNGHITPIIQTLLVNLTLQPGQEISHAQMFYASDIQNDITQICAQARINVSESSQTPLAKTAYFTFRSGSGTASPIVFEQTIATNTTNYQALNNDITVGGVFVEIKDY